MSTCCELKRFAVTSFSYLIFLFGNQRRFKKDLFVLSSISLLIPILLVLNSNFKGKPGKFFFCWQNEKSKILCAEEKQFPNSMQIFPAKIRSNMETKAFLWNVAFFLIYSAAKPEPKWKSTVKFHTFYICAGKCIKHFAVAAVISLIFIIILVMFVGN